MLEAPRRQSQQDAHLPTHIPTVPSSREVKQQLSMDSCASQVTLATDSSHGVLPEPLSPWEAASPLSQSGRLQQGYMPTAGLQKPGLVIPTSSHEQPRRLGILESPKHRSVAGRGIPAWVARL
jgi:hypothetical protein